MAIYKITSEEANLHISTAIIESYWYTHLTDFEFFLPHLVFGTGR